MKVTSSYAVEIKKQRMFDNTIKLYREAVSFLIACFNKEWLAIQSVDKAKAKFNFAEKLVHTTKYNTAKYDFDAKFYKFPCYLRRAAIQAALGAVSSYRSNYKNWEANGKVGNEPKLQCDRFCFPAFYRKDMYAESNEPNQCYLKLYSKNDWVWVPIAMHATDVKYITKYWSHCKKSAPTLEKKYGKYFLRFAFEEEVTLSDTEVQDRRICAVDLGLNTDAVCSIMTADGTVIARKFINFASEKDHLYHVLNRIKRKQREHGPKSATAMWRYVKALNDDIAKKVAAAITEFAVLYSVDVIVFEHLSFTGKKHGGSKAQKLSMWKRNSIQDYVEHKAHRCGIRISHICAWGTSKLAFDGSGALKRDETNHALATFASGKQYNCDLSARYNIGARYFVRELLKPLPVIVRSQLSAKVPEVERRIQVTLATLKVLYHEYQTLMAQAA